MSLTSKKQKPSVPPEYIAWRHSLQLALDVECYFICSLKDFLQAHDVVGVGVSEGDVVWKAADFYRLRTAPDQLVRDHDGAV